GETLRCNHAGLLGVPRIALFDRNHCELARAGLVRPYPLHVRNTGLLHLFPDVRRARNRAQERQRMRRARRIGARNNRLVAMQHALNANEWLRAARARIVARPFAEWPLVFEFTGTNFSFDDDFRIGGIRQSGYIAANHLGWTAAQTAGVIEFADSG